MAGRDFMNDEARMSTRKYEYFVYFKTRLQLREPVSYQRDNKEHIKNQMQSLKTIKLR